ncbi:DNA polymerase II [Alteromonas sp. H39]|uniref:DNA polymerase II n=1 Tax=Alteromonas sp. H39 TaxID=3389876 RepID=UPI0039E12C49
MILSRRTVTQGKQSFVELWIATDDGPVCLLTLPQTSVCFIPARDTERCRNMVQSLPVTITPSDFKTLSQEPVTLLRTQTEFQMQRLRNVLRAENITAYEADIRLPDRYLMERFIYGTLIFQGNQGNRQNTLINARVKPGRYTPTLNSLSLDIECDEHGKLFSVALSSVSWQEVILIPPDNRVPVSREALPFVLTVASDEKDLLVKLENSIATADPDLLLGWNVKQFDFAVLQQCATRYGKSLNIGRHRHAMALKTWSDGQVIVEIPGRCAIDGIEALKTMTYYFDSFALDAVADALLGEKKLIQDSDRLGAIKRLYQQDPVALAQYNFQDTELVNRIAEKTRFIDFLVLRATLTGLDLGRPGGSVAAFINVYLPKLHRHRYVSGVRPQNGGLASPGGYVMNSKPGLYQHVVVLDFKSLYPSIIRTFKIDPMGLAEGLADPDSAIPGYKNAVFSRDRHFLPDIIASLWAQRDEAKREKDAPRSQAIKILMNSFYGVLGSGGCPFYDPRLASSITLRGHDIMQTTAQWITEQGYDVIYGDTDSTFVHLLEISNATEANAIGKKLEQHINQQWQTTLREKFDLDCYLEIEFETHFDTFFMPTIRGAETGSKKRYAGLTTRNGKQELVFKGLESVRSDWTALAKTFQETLYMQVFTGQPVETFVRSTVDALRAGRHDNALIYSKRLRKPLSEYTRTVPPHVRAARLADEKNAKGNKPLRYQNKTQIRYVMTLQGPQTTECQDAPLDYDHYVEKQIKPIAESILPLIGLRFDTIVNEQMGLF